MSLCAEPSPQNLQLAKSRDKSSYVADVIKVSWNFNEGGSLLW